MKVGPNSRAFTATPRAGWQATHAKLMGLARTRAGLDFEEGLWLMLALRENVHARLGYGSFVEYVERLFGYTPRLTHEKLRVAEALEQLPLIRRAALAGELSWSASRELSRVATRATEAEWLDASRNKTVREVERLVSGHALGSRPSDAADPALKRHVLRFEVSAEVLATFREAMAKVRRDAGKWLDDDAALLILARQELGASKASGTSSYQLLLTVCEDCGRAKQRAHGESVEVDRSVVEAAKCDAQALRLTHVGGRVPLAKQAIPPALRRAVIARDAGHCVVPGCRHATFVDVHHIQPRAEGGRHQLDNLITICSAHHLAIHRGTLLVEGAQPATLQFCHADGSHYGAAVSPSRANACSRAFRALRSLGFAESEARRALAQAQAGAQASSAESLVRQGVQFLTKRARRE